MGREWVLEDQRIKDQRIAIFSSAPLSVVHHYQWCAIISGAPLTFFLEILPRVSRRVSKVCSMPTEWEKSGEKWEQSGNSGNRVETEWEQSGNRLGTCGERSGNIE